MTFGCYITTSSIVTKFLINHEYEQKIQMSFSISTVEFLYQCFVQILIDMTRALPDHQIYAHRNRKVVNSIDDVHLIKKTDNYKIHIPVLF